MKQIIILISAVLTFSHFGFAAHPEDEHLLDGTSMTYQYQNGAEVEASFADGMFHFKWLSGPLKDVVGQEAYRSRKIGDKQYLVNFMVQANKTFVTLVFNFNQNVMHSSVLFVPGTPDEQILFEGGIIEHLILKES